eukprot:TRINITY_DN7538_c0_g1_i3.p1 TRINITY_DN7538_c0_g1~~TRINITY_DN7538_c0_g1_i3.p1  ORF type:complete len:455 (+),score=158.62 TRINITY_DN7538_c0_g1_i3:99-1463(+)
MIRRPPRSTLSSSSAASDVYKRQDYGLGGQPRPLLVMDQMTEEGAVLQYVLRMEKSASYLTRQIRRAVSGGLPAAVRSEPSPQHSPAVGKVGTVVGSTLGQVVAEGDVLLQLLLKGTPSPKQLSLTEADVLSKALQHAGSHVRVVSMDPSRNACNFSDPRLPPNLAELSASCQGASTLFLPSNGGPASKFDAVNSKAAPAVQFISELTTHKFDPIKAQAHVSELAEQCTVTLHQHSDRSGVSPVFRVGRHSLADILEAGGLNDEVSSLTVGDGCQATLFEADQFTGAWNATFTPGEYSDAQLKAGGAFNDQTSSLLVAVHTPLLPPALTEAPEATVNQAGDVQVSWALPVPQEGKAQPSTFSVYSAVMKNGAGEQMQDPVPTLRSGGLTPIPGETQSWNLAGAEAGSIFEPGAQVVFHVKPVAKEGAGVLSPASNPVMIPTVADEAPAAAKDEV